MATRSLDPNPPIGTVRGPYHSSPGNPLAYQAYVRGPGGWVPFMATTARGAMHAAEAYSRKLT